MAFSFQQFNKVNFSVDTKGFTYCKLKELYNKKDVNKVHVLNGLWVSKSPLGESPVFIVAECKKLVNMPQHLTETARQILADSNAVAAIESGKVGFTIHEYEARKKVCYSINFVDIE